jgi:putative nucleotidyltransferase with HDIG domain
MRRRLRYSSPLARFRAAAQRLLARPFRRLPPAARLLLGAFVLTLLITALLTQTSSRSFVEAYREGDMVRGTIVSPADITTEDTSETEQRRQAAMDKTLPVFRFDPAPAENAARSFRAAWEDLQLQMEKRSGGAPVWAGEGGAEVGQVIIAHGARPRELDRLMRALQEATEGYVYDDADTARLRPEIRVIDARSGMQSVISAMQNRMTAVSAARQSLQARLAALAGWSRDERAALAAALLPLVRPNIFFDETATEQARAAAARAVPPATIALKRNQLVARDGDLVTPQMLSQFAAIRAYEQTKRRPHRFIGIFLIVGALFWVVWKFTEHRSAVTNLSLTKQRAFILVGLSVTVETILMRVGFTVADSIAAQSLSPPLNDPATWSLAIPYAAAALLVTLLVDAQLGLITALVTALFAGLMATGGMLMSFYAMISSSAAIYGISKYCERQSVTVAGLLTAAVNALMAVAMILSAQQPFTLNAVLLAMSCGVLSGMLTTIFTSGGLPVNESLFGILTDIKLLELSNADLPALGQLALHAPGTNQHSHAVGQLAEEACRAVGASPLLARIGALYHDIGKLAAPNMFVENQQGDNPHDRLRPSQSARIIISHVTYGLKLAKEIGLPQQIADFIPQHHGTRQLHFFLRKAQSQAAPGEVVDEAEFRYPGPKPQFKEAAIMMLADSCEAAVRSLAQPDADNIRAIVTKIFDCIISDGQLDECNLTLRELRVIRESMISSLTAIYHGRIDYPGFNPPPNTGPLTGSLPEPELDTEERGLAHSARSTSAVNLKRAELPAGTANKAENQPVLRKVAKR